MADSTPGSDDGTGGVGLARILHDGTGIEILLLVLVLLHFAIPAGGMTHPGLYLGACLAYGVLLAAVHRFPADRSRDQRLLAIVAMVALITAVLALTGDGRERLAGLYLLPVIGAALTLGRGMTIAIVGLVLAARLVLDWLGMGREAPGLASSLALVAGELPMLLVALVTAALAGRMADAREKLQVMADHDPLTGLLTLSAFSQLVETERERAIQRGSGFAVLLVDIDGLKLINARHGHDAGDRVLAAVAAALRRSTRSVDLVARYGGDEFLLFVSGAGPAVAKAVANRIRHNIGTTTVEIGGVLQRVTVGIGAGVFPGDGRSLLDLGNAAGRAMAKDKDRRRPPALGTATPPAAAARG